MFIFISICIPAYNRPKALIRLLNSIDINQQYKKIIEIVIVEDKSPLRLDIRNEIDLFKKKSDLIVNYFENEINFAKNKMDSAQKEYIKFKKKYEKLLEDKQN